MDAPLDCIANTNILRAIVVNGLLFRHGPTFLVMVHGSLNVRFRGFPEERGRGEARAERSRRRRRRRRREPLIDQSLSSGLDGHNDRSFQT